MNPSCTSVIVLAEISVRSLRKSIILTIQICCISDQSIPKSVLNRFENKITVVHANSVAQMLRAMRMAHGDFVFKGAFIIIWDTLIQ